MKLLLALALALTGCKNKEAGGGGAVLAKLAGYRDEMCQCKDTTCAQAVSDKITKWTHDTQTTTAKMSEADQKKVVEIGEATSKCMEATLPKPTGSAAPAGSGSDAAADAVLAQLPPECTEYKKAIDKLATCDKMAAAAREPLRQAYSQAAAGWAKLPPDSRTTLKTPCKMAVDAVMNLGKQSCGW